MRVKTMNKIIITIFGLMAILESAITKKEDSVFCQWLYDNTFIKRIMK